MALPPVEILITASVACLICGRNAKKSFANGLGRRRAGYAREDAGSRHRARAASIADWAMASAVTGRWGDIDGVWIEPVGAQVMMTLGDLRMVYFTRRPHRSRAHHLR